MGKTSGKLVATGPLGQSWIIIKMYRGGQERGKAVNVYICKTRYWLCRGLERHFASRVGDRVCLMYQSSIGLPNTWLDLNGSVGLSWLKTEQKAANIQIRALNVLQEAVQESLSKWVQAVLKNKGGRTKYRFLNLFELYKLGFCLIYFPCMFAYVSIIHYMNFPFF